MQISKWGNSLGVRLPAALVRELQLTEGDVIDVRAKPSSRTTPVTLTVQRLPNKLERLQTMRRHRAAFPPDFVFTRDEANAR